MARLSAGTRHEVRFRLNGRERRVQVENRMLLSDLIRHELGLTGTHVGCEHGVCGACTVQIGGAAARSCLVLAAQAEGLDIRTVEDLAPQPAPLPGPQRLSVLQATFRRHHALQCGFCTSGILMTLDALFSRDPDAPREAILDALSGHLCRCTGYEPIIRAALEARDNLKEGQTRA